MKSSFASWLRVIRPRLSRVPGVARLGALLWCGDDACGAARGAVMRGLRGVELRGALGLLDRGLALRTWGAPEAWLREEWPPRCAARGPASKAPSMSESDATRMWEKR